MTNINLNKILYSGIMKYKILLIAYASILIGFILGKIIFPKSCSKFIDTLPKDKNMMFKLISIPIIILAISEILNFISTTIIAKYYNYLEIYIVNTTLQQTLDILKNNPKKNIDKTLLSRNIIKILDIKHVLRLFVTKVLPPLIFSFVLFLYFLFVDKKLAFISLGLSLLSITVIFFAGYHGVDKFTIHDGKFNKYISEIDDIIENIDTIIHNNMINYEISRLFEIENKTANYYIDSGYSVVKFKITVAILSFIFIFLLGGSLLKNYINNNISKGITIIYLYLILSLLVYYADLSENINEFLHYFGNYRNAVQYFNTFYDNDKTYPKINITEGKIEFKDIELYLGEKKIYDKYSVTIPPNSITGITGEIGKGKTSLLKLILGYYEYNGLILIDGQDIRKYNRIDIRQYISYIPQHPKFFNRSILENILYGSNYTEKQLNDLIISLNLTNFINSFPNKLNTQIIDNGINISGGQKQIIYLLKTIVLNKKIILMDEPTSNLDIYYTDLIKNLIKTLKNKTIVIVSHDTALNEIFENKIKIE